MRDTKKIIVLKQIFFKIIIFLIIVIFLVIINIKFNSVKNIPKERIFDGNKILSIIDQQLHFGPRYLSAPGHKEVQKFLISEMDILIGEKETKTQIWQHEDMLGQKNELTNIIGRLYPEKERRIILAAHYDSKKLADMDKRSELRKNPVPGANDSASGVAVILELARVLKNFNKLPNVGIDIVFLDGEEGEENQISNDKNWKPLGSTYFGEHINDIYKNSKPISAIVIDMVCDKNLRIYKEKSSIQNAQEQVELFWDIAMKNNRKVFRDKIGQEIGDDHLPLNKAGIPTFLVGDFNYSSWHTTNDTLDKCSPNSLEVIASTVFDYIYAIK